MEILAQANGDAPAYIFFPLYAVVVVVPCVFCFLKGKLVFGLIWLFGFLIPLAWIGAVRIALPTSWWARRYYPPGSPKAQLSRERFPPPAPTTAGEGSGGP